jgi:hypothetical protein
MGLAASEHLGKILIDPRNSNVDSWIAISPDLSRNLNRDVQRGEAA